jgi:hypothetical protein
MPPVPRPRLRTPARELGYAVLGWLVPFVVSVCIFPLKQSHPPLFDSLMGVTLASSTVVLALLYLRRVPGDPTAASVRIGLTWLAANWLLDGLMFSAGPMKMPFTRYIADIGTAYLMLPVITFGLGVAVMSRSTGRSMEREREAHVKPRSSREM